MHLLEKIDSPQALKALDAAKLPALCAEIREFLIENVSRTGGHLSSNLGTVELTVALHRVFDSHQANYNKKRGGIRLLFFYAEKEKAHSNRNELLAGTCGN